MATSFGSESSFPSALFLSLGSMEMLGEHSSRSEKENQKRTCQFISDKKVALGGENK